MKKNYMMEIGKIILLLFVLQAVLYILKSIIFIFAQRTLYSDSIASMVCMIIITFIFILIMKRKREELSVFPKHFGAAYITFTIVFICILVYSLTVSAGSWSEMLLVIYGTVITPVYEELIFRGYVWNKLSRMFDKEWKTYIITSVLFGLWHFGYIGSISFRVSGGLLNIMFWKCITGLCFGLVLGVMRIKTKNCYSTILLHGIMNMFGK